MPRRLLAVLTGGLLLVLCSSALAAPSNVTVRIEGASQTLVPETALRTDTRTVNKDGQAGHNCTGTSAAGALEIATAGDWGGQWFDGLGYSVERIKAETHTFPEPDFFTLWVNNRESQTGVCGVELQEGDEMLLFVARCELDPNTFQCTNPPVRPLGLSVPSTVRPGTPFDVRVVEYASNGDAAPAAGATVSGGDGPATANADGVATITVGERGTRGLRATEANRAPSATETVCSTDGADGFCGTTASDGTTRGPAPTPGAPARPCQSDGRDGRCGTRDREHPHSFITSIREQQVFGRGRGPRTLEGLVGIPSRSLTLRDGLQDAGVRPDPSGLLTVKLRLTRTAGDRCTYFSGRSERFRPNRRGRCGAANGYWFAIGDRAEWSYLLPERLPRGRYVLDVNAVDRAGNRDDDRRRRQNRIVFRVR